MFNLFSHGKSRLITPTIWKNHVFLYIFFKHPTSKQIEVYWRPPKTTCDLWPRPPKDRQSWCMKFWEHSTNMILLVNLGRFEWRNLKEAPLKSYCFILLFINFSLPFTAKHDCFFLKWTYDDYQVQLYWTLFFAGLARFLRILIPPRNARTILVWTEILHHSWW